MNTLILVLGTACFLLGLLSVLSDTFNEKMDILRIKNRSESDKKLFPGKSGYFISRYLAGVRFIFLGIVLLAIYFW